MTDLKKNKFFISVFSFEKLYSYYLNIKVIIIKINFKNCFSFDENVFFDINK